MAIRLSTSEFITKAKEKHNEYYKYDSVVYKNSHTNVIITCPIHGDFNQLPNNHLNGAGCILCGYDRMTSKSKISEETFLLRCKHKHGDDFDYSAMHFKNMTTPITVTHKCGYTFTTTPASHLTTTTCMQCSIAKLASHSKAVSQTAKEKFYAKYADTYEFISSYTKARFPITVKHKKCGHIFTTTPDNLKVERCPSCADHGFNPSLPAILYYLSIDNGMYYKIGITNRSVKERFTSMDLQKITILKEWAYPSGALAYSKEQQILTQFSTYKANTPGILSSGNSEIFTIDILQLGLLNEEYFTDGT